MTLSTRLESVIELSCLAYRQIDTHPNATKRITSLTEVSSKKLRFLGGFFCLFVLIISRSTFVSKHTV